ncbi:MAG: hypothetical protein QHH13_14375, partial [Melioribacter sp.]|nr:hypothetical protein [Melioribacter sp.]
MKEIRFRLFLVLGAIALSVYLLIPTYKDYLNNKKVTQQLSFLEDSLKKSNPNLPAIQIKEFINNKRDSILSNNPDYRAAREKRVKLGLDLQGGMYLVMEVNTAKLLEKLAKDPDDQFNQILKEAENESRLSNENVVSILARKLKEKGIWKNYFSSMTIIVSVDLTLSSRRIRQVTISFSLSIVSDLT